MAVYQMSHRLSQRSSMSVILSVPSSPTILQPCRVSPAFAAQRQNIYRLTECQVPYRQRWAYPHSLHPGFSLYRCNLPNLGQQTGSQQSAQTIWASPQRVPYLGQRQQQRKNLPRSCFLRPGNPPVLGIEQAAFHHGRSSHPRRFTSRGTRVQRTRPGPRRQ